MTRKLEINWMELDAAFQSGSWEMRYFLDVEPAEVVLVTDEVAHYLEEPLDDELPAGTFSPGDSSQIGLQPVATSTSWA
jgi:hypothetical protein